MPGIYPDSEPVTPTLTELRAAVVRVTLELYDAQGRVKVAPARAVELRNEMGRLTDAIRYRLREGES